MLRARRPDGTAKIVGALVHRAAKELDVLAHAARVVVGTAAGRGGDVEITQQSLALCVKTFGHATQPFG